MPKATLAGIVFMIGVSLIDFAGLRVIRKERFSELVVAVLTAVTVFAIGVEQGIILAVVASILEVIRRAYSPSAFVIGQGKDGGPRTFAPASAGAQSRAGLIVFRFDAPLFYANAGRFTDDIKKVVEGAPDPVRWVVVLAETLDDIDYSAGVQVRDLVRYLDQLGITLAFAGLEPQQEQSLTNYKVLGGDSKVRRFSSADEAVAAFEAEPSAAVAQP
jgi:MFS superfamily sulfate permease-like transporter